MGQYVADNDDHNVAVHSGKRMSVHEHQSTVEFTISPCHISSFPLFANDDSLGRGAIIKMFNFLLPVTTLAIVRNQSPLQKVFSPVITPNFIECI